jgi:hypothetical protein
LIKFIGCPESNFRRGRPFGLAPEAIVIHIMDGTFAAGESVFRNPKTQKSAHYGISREGELHQYVDEHNTAFHAGIVVNPTWPLLRPRINPNFYTIGFEHEGRPDDVWPEVQLSASAALIADIAERWEIPLDEEHVIRHHQIRASKTCPGNWLQIGELLERALAVPRPRALAAGASPGNASGISVSADPLIPLDVPPQQREERQPIILTSHSPIVTAPATITTPVSVTPSDSATIGVVASIASSAQTKLVRLVKNANLRRGPTTSAQLVRVIPAHFEVAVMKFETGQRIDGNAFWYVDVDGNYLWAGATESPDPRNVVQGLSA